MRKDLVRKSLALALVMMILLTNSVEMITSVYAEDVKDLEEVEEVKEEEFQEDAEDESDVEIDSEEEVEPKLEVEKEIEEEFQEDAEKNELEGEAEEETEPESEVDESETEGNTTFEDGVRKVSNQEELIEALKDNNVERIIITRDMELDRLNDDFKDERIINKGIIIEGEEGKKPTLTTKDGKRHFYINKKEKVIFKNLIFKDDSKIINDELGEVIGGGIESSKNIEVDIEISNCEFEENRADSANEVNFKGGAIYIKIGQLNLEDTHFKSSDANGIAWAIFMGDGELDIKKCEFNFNGVNKFDGAIFTGRGKVKIKDSNFKSNGLGVKGWAISTYQGEIKIENSEFNSGGVDKTGGVIYIMGGELSISVTIFQVDMQNDVSLIELELENDIELELNEIYLKNQNNFIGILSGTGYNIENTISCNIELKNSVIESDGINLISYEDLNIGGVVARNDEILVAYNGNPFELAEIFEGGNPQGTKETKINLIVDKTFFDAKKLNVYEPINTDLEIDVNFYNNTIVNDNSLKLGNVRGLFAHNTIKTEDLEFEELEFKVGQEGIQFKNNIIIADTEGIEGQNILLKTNDETGISDVIENDLTIIEDGGPGVRKYFKPVENSKAKGFEPINNIGELSNDMLGNARTYSVTAGAVEAETVVNTPKDDPDIPSDSGSSETPKEPETPEVPKEPETPEVPKEPETPEVPKEPETPEVPKEPETPEVPKEPETPEVPKEPETPKKQETSRSSGGSSRGRREKIMTLIGNGGTFAGEDLSVKLNKGDKIIEPKRGNFELIGWTSKQGGKLEKSTEELQEILENLTRSEEYYALWREKTLNREDHLGYIKGYPDGRVLPENNVSREEVAAIFYRLLDDNYKSKVRRDNNDFTDVDGNRWSNVEVSTLSKAGIINGYEDGSFRPQNKITRAEVATIASRFDNLSAGEASFADIDGHWAKDYIVSASIKGWIRGYEDGSFRPNDYITRAELVTLVNNVLERKVRKENILSGIKEFKDLDKNKWYYENMVEAINSHEYEMLEDGTEKWIKLIDKSF